jgi:NIMA (never in mitosis gene a)-related kinase
MRGTPAQVEELIANHRYAVIRKVGQGSFGKAILVEKGDLKYICKCVDLRTASKSQRDAAIEESRLLSSLKSPYIVRHRESFTDCSALCIVMDYCEGGDLASRIGLMWRRRKFFDEEQVLSWTTQVLLALEYIHGRNVIHRDVKPGNLFLTKGGSLQLGDFGVAKALASGSSCAIAQVGTPSYLSPEVCQGRPYNCASDIWAMGCILHELLTLHVPFESMNLPGLMEMICKEPVPILAGLCSDATENLYVAMLNRDPEMRLSARAALQTPLLQGYFEAECERLDCAKGGSASHRTNGMSLITCGPATPYREGDEVEYLSEPDGQWIATMVIAIRADGSLRVASKPDRWVSKTAQCSRVRLLRIREHGLEVGRKRAPSPSFGGHQLCASVRQRVANPGGVLVSPGRLAPVESDLLSKSEVASRLLGKSSGFCRPRVVSSNNGRLIACY